MTDETDEKGEGEGGKGTRVGKSSFLFKTEKCLIKSVAVGDLS